MRKAEKIYRKITKWKYIFLVLLFVMCLSTFIIDLFTGPAELSIREGFSTIFSPHSQPPINRVIIWTIRLPMALMAIVVGASLGVAGAQMQTILNNPLASPYTLGISAGAGFGAALALVFGMGIIPHVGEFLVPLNAFFFSLLTCLLIYSIGKARRRSAETMILAGIAVMFLFNSLTAFLQYKATMEALQAVVFWLFGSLTKATWLKLNITFICLVVVIALLSVNVWKLTVLRLGDEVAASLGIKVERLRLEIFIYVSLLTGVAVCFVGTIGFIGLVAPHIARMCVGEDQRFFLPASIFGGAFLLSAASIGSKLIMPGTYFPIGILTSFIGVPFFLFIIFMRRREYW